MSTESEESSGIIEFLAWVETHRQTLIVGGMGAMVVGGIIYIMQWKSDQNEKAAGGALYEVQVNESETDAAKKPSAEAYLAVESGYGGTSAAERALLLAARTHFVAGDYDQAKSLFSRFEAEYGASQFVSTALYGVAASEDAAGKLAEAKSGYQAVLNRFANTPIAAQAKLAMASIHESSDEAVEALALYDDLNRPGVPISYSTRALTRREKLLDEHPELRPEPASDLTEASSGSVGASAPSDLGGSPEPNEAVATPKVDLSEPEQSSDAPGTPSDESGEAGGEEQ